MEKSCCCLNKIVGLPLTKEEIQGKIMHAFIHLLNWGDKPKFESTSNRKLSRTLSKVLVMSNLSIIPFSLQVTLECIASCTRTILYVICLPYETPFFSKINRGRMELR